MTSPPSSAASKLGPELLLALERSLLAGVAAFTGTLTVTTVTDAKAALAAAVGAGVAALTSLGNSLRTIVND